METKKKIMMRYLIIITCLVFVSCQESFFPEFANEPPQIVVEGYIQAGEQATPSLVTISKTYPLFQQDTVITPQQFLGGATVKVSDGESEITLAEICTDDLDPVLEELVKETLGIDTILEGFDICFYADILQQMPGEIGKEYQLTVNFEGKTLTAKTTIPNFVSIDSIQLMDQIGEVQLDNYRQMFSYISDPAGENYYRLKVGIDGGPFLSDFRSVTDDPAFDGSTFGFPVNKPFPRDQEDFDPNLAGLFEVGDTAVLQWQLIDRVHFDFWNTLEFAQGNQGPFSSYSRAASNIDGGIGIWGGSSIEYYTIIIE